MPKINQGRMAAQIEGDFVVFLIGMRINKIWKVWKWLPVMTAMPRMLVELAKHPELGLLHARTHFGIRNVMVVQYWRSFEQLHRYAIDKDLAHLPAWAGFNRAIGENEDVGIWHETYLTNAGACEAIYTNMPTYGLGRAGDIFPATGQARSAKGRLKKTDGRDVPVMDEVGKPT